MTPQLSKARACRLLRATLLHKKPRSPSMSDWCSVEPTLDFLLHGQVGDCLAALYRRAHQKITPSEEANLAHVDPTLSDDFLLGLTWHQVAGKRYLRGLNLLTNADAKWKQRALSVVLEPMRWLCSWWTSASHGRWRRQLGRMPPVVDLASLESSPPHVVMQYYSWLLTGDAPRLRLVWQWETDFDFIEDWWVAEPAKRGLLDVPTLILLLVGSAVFFSIVGCMMLTLTGSCMFVLCRFHFPLH